MSNGPIPVNTPQQPNAPQMSSPSPLASPAHTNTPLMNTPASTPTSNVMTMQNSTTSSSSSIGKTGAIGGPNQNDRTTPISRPMNLPTQQMTSALESSTQERDEDSQSPSDNNSIKGKCDIKQEHDIKSEMDEESALMDTNSNNSNSNCGGKSINNDMAPSIKMEIKTEAMDQGDNNSADSENDDMNETKDEMKDEPLSPVEIKPKIEKKSAIPEPIEQDMSEKDKKKKCRKYF